MYRIKAYLVFKGHLQDRCGFSGNYIYLHIPSVDPFIVLGPLKKVSTGGCDLVKKSLVEKKLVLPLRWRMCRRQAVILAVLLSTLSFFRSNSLQLNKHVSNVYLFTSTFSGN